MLSNKIISYFHHDDDNHHCCHCHHFPKRLQVHFVHSYIPNIQNNDFHAVVTQ